MTKARVGDTVIFNKPDGSGTDTMVVAQVITEYCGYCVEWYTDHIVDLESDSEFNYLTDDEILSVIPGEADDDPTGKIYYIQNTVNEWNFVISGYFDSLDDAIDALKQCSDWYRPNGTGRIYSIRFGLGQTPVLEYERR